MKETTKENQNTLKDLYEKSFNPLQDGQITKGKIVSIGPKEVLIDVNYKSEGIIPVAEFFPDELVLGKEVEVLVESLEDDHGMIILSHEKARRLQGWDRIIRNSKEGDFVDGRITKKVKGGFLVNVFGIEGFLPLSLSMFKNLTDREILDKSFKFKLIKLNHLRRSIILSRKEAMQKEREEIKEKVWQNLKIGGIYTGTVKSITDFGAFIDLGGVDGLLHITDMSWSRISHPSEIVAVGDKIEVMILNIDKEQAKVSLGLKQRFADPWADVEEKFPAGTKVKGKVVNILPYGVFIELEKGIEGLVHISEISWAKRITNLQDIFAIGDTVEAQILNIDKDTRRLSLSIKQLEVNPWVGVEEKFKTGAIVPGRICGFTDYGAFVELDQNLEGMIHVSDLHWTKRIAHPQEVLKKGQKIDIMVLAVDGKSRRISLGLKQLEPNPWIEIAKLYPVDSILDAEVINTTDFGVFVKLTDTLEGLIYSSEIDKDQMEKLKAGDKIKVKIIKIDVEQAKIGLTAKI